VIARGRPAFYALAPGSWRDYVTLLHLPYTAWHLSYVAIGAGLAARLDGPRLAVSLAAFFLGLGLGAHALDELSGRPLSTDIPSSVLVAIGATSLLGALGLGVYASVAYTPWLAPLVAFGGLIAPAYNLEWLGGRLHTDIVFGLSWGALPVLAGYLAQAERVRGEAAAAAVFAFFLSLAQRRLSTEARLLRRRASTVSGEIVLDDGTATAISAGSLARTPEAALRLLTLAVVSLAVALVLVHSA
jgi:hypothetical protein